jgi:hypothetical protein
MVIRMTIVAMATMLAACSSPRTMDHGTATQVNLDHANYHVIKTGAVGSSSGFWLLFLPLAGRSYAEAKANLYRSVGTPLEGRSIALANETEDSSFFSLLLFSIPTLTLTADVIEFSDAAPRPHPPTAFNEAPVPQPDDVIRSSRPSPTPGPTPSDASPSR